VGNSLIDMYAKCGSMEDAQRVFNEMPSHNVVSWTTMLQGCAMHGHGKEALQHFEQMCEEGVKPDIVTFFVFCQLVAMQDWWTKSLQVCRETSQRYCNLVMLFCLKTCFWSQTELVLSKCLHKVMKVRYACFVIYDHLTVPAVGSIDVVLEGQLTM